MLKKQGRGYSSLGSRIDRSRLRDRISDGLVVLHLFSKFGFSAEEANRGIRVAKCKFNPVVILGLSRFNANVDW